MENNNSDLNGFIVQLDKLVTENSVQLFVFECEKNKNRKSHQTNGISDYIRSIDREAKFMISNGYYPDNVKFFLQEQLEKLLFLASKKKLNGEIDSQDKSSQEIRKAIWTLIRQYISKNGMLFVENERPQAKQGMNWLVKWSEPQTKVFKKIIKNRLIVKSGAGCNNNDIKSYTLEKVAIAIEVALIVKNDKNAAYFLMERFQKAVNQGTIYVEFNISDIKNYTDFFDFKGNLTLMDRIS